MAAGPRPLVPLLCVLSIGLFGLATSDEVTALLQFKATVTDPLGSLRGWEQNSSPCGKPNWFGIVCDPQGAVRGIQLENSSLSGRLNLDPLTALPSVRALSFANNSFTGPLPNLKNFKGLKSAYFSSNNLAGEILDDAFDGMQSLKMVVLSRNGFTGRIPSSLVRVSPLLELWLDGNAFVGEIPNFQQSGLRVVNVANNNLEGPIPERLSKMDPSMFAGNKALCGPPLTAQCPVKRPPPQAQPPSSSSHKKLPATLITAIAVVGVGVLLAVVGAAFAFTRHRKQKKQKMGQAGPFQKPDKDNGERRGGGAAAATTNKKAVAPTDERDQGKLIFTREDRVNKFELQDLLQASAEVLGSGEFGSSYKALLLSGPAVVVKRFKEMNKVGREEFQEHMRRLGRLSHPNLLPLVAYYYRKEEKLLVTDFIPYGSLARLLHGNRTADNPAVDWPMRLRIVKGIARGLSYLYQELSTIAAAPHGHLKSSNVLLNENYEPLLTDYGLLPVTNQSHASQVMIAYRAPEFKQYGRVSKKSDVWSLGVLILEVLTGKYPGDYSRQMRDGSDLANWVNSVVREEWTGEVFDGEMKRTRNGEGEMLNLLQIGLGCCEVDVNKRWELRVALEKIEELKEKEGDEEYYSSFLSEGEGGYSSRGGVTEEGEGGYSSRGGATEDGFSFSTNNP